MKRINCLVRAMVAAGAADGITGARDGSVDGLPQAQHVGMLRQLRGILEDEFGGRAERGAGAGAGARP